VGRLRIWLFPGNPTPFCATARNTDWPTPSGEGAELWARATGITAFGYVRFSRPTAAEPRFRLRYKPVPREFST